MWTLTTCRGSCPRRSSGIFWQEKRLLRRTSPSWPSRGSRQRAVFSLKQRQRHRGLVHSQVSRIVSRCGGCGAQMELRKLDGKWWSDLGHFVMRACRDHDPLHHCVQMRVKCSVGPVSLRHSYEEASPVDQGTSPTQQVLRACPPKEPREGRRGCADSCKSPTKAVSGAEAANANCMAW